MQVAVADRDWPLDIPAPCKTKFQDKASRGESWHPEVLKAFGSLSFNAWLGTYLVASLHLSSGRHCEKHASAKLPRVGVVRNMLDQICLVVH